MDQQNEQKIVELRNEIENVKEKSNNEMAQKIIELENQNAKLAEENRELKEKMAIIEAYMKKVDKSILFNFNLSISPEKIRCSLP